ncbi:phenazine biosynthesis-like domain-containing protein isoform X2 [Watersipora subatra]|uniref:phenazine biosynthesis-like domain-containing protein isoform X2 n=1 Tax=Watersipora subatra TaxID=2589382 RepID=UPI00355B3976
MDDRSGSHRMDLPIYTVDSFSSTPFGGNPAAVCIIRHNQRLTESTMQGIASEMNLSDTAFVQELKEEDLSKGDRFGLRWFTPANEVSLCGHATLASAAVLFQKYENGNKKIRFETKSGTLVAENNGDVIVMELPLPDLTDQMPEDTSAVLEIIVPNFKAERSEMVLRYSPMREKLLVRLPPSWSRDDLESVEIPDSKLLLAAHDASKFKAVILTTNAPASSTSSKPYDFISRYFAAWNGISEDPVTGSAHTVLGKFWSEELGASQFYARQCSKRGGDLTVHIDATKGSVYVGGPACLFLCGSIRVCL